MSPRINKLLLVPLAVLGIVLMASSLSKEVKRKELLAPRLQFVPSGYTDIESPDLDDWSEWWIAASYTDEPAEGFTAFYEVFAEENDWILATKPGESSDTTLRYEKLGAEFTVRILDDGDGKLVSLSYDSYPWTFEDFSRFTEISVAPEALALIEQVNRVYDEANSYADTGILINYADGESISELSFRTAYKKGAGYFFEYAQTEIDGRVFWAWVKWDGESATFRSSSTHNESFDAPELALASLFGSATGASGGALHFVIGQARAGIFNLAHVKLIEDAAMENGVACKRIRGTDYGGDQVTIWVDGESLLIRKVVRGKGDGDDDVSTYEPRLNEPVSDADLSEPQLH